MLYVFMSLVDHEKVFTIEKNGSSGYGIHIIGSYPAVITQIDEGSPGAKAGVQEGQIVISINSVNVLEQDHDEIIRLVQESKLRLNSAKFEPNEPRQVNLCLQAFRHDKF